MRFVIALNLDDTVRNALARLLGRVRVVDPELRWSKVADLHVVVARFEDNVSDDDLPAIEERLEAIKPVEPLRLSCTTVGSLNTMGAMNLLVVRIDPEGTRVVRDLGMQITKAFSGVKTIAKSDFFNERHPTMPHIPLARRRRGSWPEPEPIVAAVARETTGLLPTPPWVATELTLTASERVSSGPLQTVLYRRPI